MSQTIITCPKCGASMPLDEAVSHRLRDELSSQFEKERSELNAALLKREQQLAAEKAGVDAQAKSIQEELARQVDAEREKLKAGAQREAEERFLTEVRALKEQSESHQTKLREAQQAELDLRRKNRELEEAKAAMDLEISRKLDEERQKISDQARQQGVESERLKTADKDNLIRGLQDQISALQQRAGQGSMQLQGETLELELEKDLRTAFPFDEIIEIKKGQRGADILQRVRTNSGSDCGSILWEAKRAKSWSGDWPEKLKEDQREAKADLAVILTTCPPDGLRGIGLRDGVWVVEHGFGTALAVALRQGIIATAAQRVQQANRADKMSALYDHLCSVEFRQHIEALVESFIGLRQQLDAEKRAFARQWNEREQQIEKAINHIAMVYGGVQGIAGRQAIPEIPSLALPGII
jgi:hypothetical protein